MTLSKIVAHWSAGTNYPNAIDREHYHYIIDKDGKIHEGKYKPEDNINCNDGKYAQHTGGGNTGAIGVSFAGMLGYKSPKYIGKYPITKLQLEAGLKFIAQLCKKHRIPVTPLTVYTHYEFGKAHPKTSSAGKIDLTFLPPYSEIEKDKTGDFLRQKVQWYLEKI